MTTARLPAAQPWRNRTVGHGDVPPADLVPNPRNWRGHPIEQQRALSGALAEVGWVAEVLVNKTTGHVVDGHLRIELALARKEPSVPVTYVELSDEEEQLVLATLDPLAAMATAEKDALEALLARLSPADEALAALLAELAEEHGITKPLLGKEHRMAGEEAPLQRHSRILDRHELRHESDRQVATLEVARDVLS